jgi:hypothetical protein
MMKIRDEKSMEQNEINMMNIVSFEDAGIILKNNAELKSIREIDPADNRIPAERYDGRRMMRIDNNQPAAEKRTAVMYSMSGITIAQGGIVV